MTPLDAINPVSETVKSVIHGADSILDILKKWQQYRISDITTLKMLYLELDRYMEVIEVLSLKCFSGARADLATMAGLLSGIECTVMGLVLAKEEKYSVFKKIMRRGRKIWQRDYENILQALSFIYSKTLILKQIAASGDKKLLKEIKLKERLSNIREGIDMVMKVLVTFREVNIIARRWHCE